MANVGAVERGQQWLMPPSLRDWLPADHLAWLIVDVVSELDLSGFYAVMRADGRGGGSYDPQLMVGVLFYAYCVGERSSRRIERRLSEDVAFRVVGANQRPDHATLARFRRTHQEAIGGLFAQVLGLCAAEGLIASGVVAIDGTKVEADVSSSEGLTRRQIAEELLAEAERVDAAEDETFGERRGGELPERWADSQDRRARLREALRQLDAEGPSDPETAQQARAAREQKLGRKLGGREPNPEACWGSVARTRRINITDPDCRTLKDGHRFLWGYNAQAAVDENQFVVAADVTNAARDSVVFAEMTSQVITNLTRIGCLPSAVVADAGYWSPTNASMRCGAEVLISPMRATSGVTDPDDPRHEQRRDVIQRLDGAQISVAEAARHMNVSTTWTRRLLGDYRKSVDVAAARAEMLARLDSPAGAAAFAKRKTTVEPVFGCIKHNRGYRRFSRRGLRAVTSEWQLICTAHNLRKPHRHLPAIA